MKRYLPIVTLVSVIVLGVWVGVYMLFLKNLILKDIPWKKFLSKERCIPSGDARHIQAALIEEGSKAILCPNAVFEIFETVNFTANNQEIYTSGFPTDDSRALLKLVNDDIVVAISANNKSGVKLRNIKVDGNRAVLGAAFGHALKKAGGLIEFGGAAQNQLVEWVKAYEPRHWSVLVIAHGNIGAGPGQECEGVVIQNNEIGPSGREWGIADGISLACRNAIVINNTVSDATDIGIVIFGAPGSLIANNTVRAVNQALFVGINLGDPTKNEGDYTYAGTRVTGNTIDADGALIRIGIGMGDAVGCIPPNSKILRNRGATITNNRLKGNYMGYGFPIAGVEEWTATGNVDASTHFLPVRTDECWGKPMDLPGGHQIRSDISSGTFQEDYEETVFQNISFLWPLFREVNMACVKDFIGIERLQNIKNGQQGLSLLAIEKMETGGLIWEKCISSYRTSKADVGPVLINIHSCEPSCASLELINPTEKEINLENAEFFVEGFPVACRGVQQFIPANYGSVRCTIDDYIGEGFQLIWWRGFPAAYSEIGYTYPLPPQ